MVAIEWNACPRVGQAFMDQDHEDTVTAINTLQHTAALAKSGDTGAAEALKMQFSEFEHHLAEHFAREEAAMQATGFFAFDCHVGEHKRVLELVASLWEAIDQQNFEALSDFLEVSLPDWFFGHLSTMDSVTAQFLSQSGYAAA